MSIAYILLKDLPNLKMGATIEYNTDTFLYEIENDDIGHFFSLYPEAVEKRPDWFIKATDFDNIYCKNDLIDFGTFICKKSVSKLLSGQDYIEDWISSKK